MAENDWVSSTVKFVKMSDVETKIIEEIAASRGTHITVSPTPPSNPQINDLWIQTDE